MAGANKGHSPKVKKRKAQLAEAQRHKRQDARKRPGGREEREYRPR
jgi:hypothetical protein